MCTFKPCASGKVRVCLNQEEAARWCSVIVSTLASQQDALESVAVVCLLLQAVPLQRPQKCMWGILAR